MTTHQTDCKWERTTEADCEYRATHHYCPHPEHGCTCAPSIPEPVTGEEEENGIPISDEMREAVDAYSALLPKEGAMERLSQALYAAMDREQKTLASYRKLQTELEEARKGWQPIETVPKDGSEVILRVEFRAGIRGGTLVGHYMPGGHCIEDHPPIDEGWYFWNGCRFDKAAKPTHWMPLPEVPQ